MNRYAHTIIHFFEDSTYARWSRRCGFVAGVVCAQYVLNIYVEDGYSMIPQKQRSLNKSYGFNWWLYVGINLTTLFSFSSAGFILGPVLPILVMPGVLYKLTDSMPEPEQKETMQ